MRVFDNVNALRKWIIERRLQTLDANATANPYSVERPDKSLHHYVGVHSSLSDAQIESCLGPIDASDTQAETAEREQLAFLQIAKQKYQELLDAGQAQKVRVDKIETEAKKRGWPF